MAAQGQQRRGWRSADLTSRFDPAKSRGESSRVPPPPPSRARRVSCTRVGGTVSGADTGLIAQSPTVAGMGYP
jgi:hypothetical protein